MRNYFYTLLLIIITCNYTKQQQKGIPNNNCPTYFQYIHDGSQYFGRISPPNVGNNIVTSVHFAQRTLLREDYPLKGLLTLESRNPFRYRMEFPSPNEVPILTKITVNGKDICSSDDYLSEGTTFSITHTFRTSTRTRPCNRGCAQPLPQTQPVITTSSPKIYSNPFLQKYPQSPTKAPQLSSRQSVTEHIAHFNPVKVTSPKIYSNPFLKQATQSPQKVPQLVSSAPQNGDCGKENNIVDLIVGGEELFRGQFPWLTAIYQKHAGLKFICGGSLVSPRTVVTAGHCIKRHNLSADRLLVHLGRHNLDDFSDESYVTREIEKLAVHPQYNPTVFPDADLAILQLVKSVEYTTYIRPICLWTESTDSHQLVGQNGVIAGWGADGTGRSSTAIPKKVNTNIVSDTECRNSSVNYNSLLSRRTFCAGNRDGTGPCNGDSGSGFLMYRNDRWYLRGVVSAGQMKQHICDLDHFVVFCDVTQHLQWVQSQMVS